MPTSRGLWALVLGFMALHVALAMSLPLIEDEAYYKLWASVPSAGYYDHPPMIAWWIAAGEALVGHGLLGVRLMSIFASVLATVLVWRIAWLYCEDHKVAFIAALWSKSMVPFAMLGFVATPDAPSILFWTAAVWALAEVLKTRQANWWLLVGLFAGLGVLSKFTDFFFGLSLVIWLLATRKGRAWLSVWQVWGGALVGIAVLLPFLWWNYQHGWIGFERQFGRIGTEKNLDFIEFLTFFVSIVLLVTPLIFWHLLRSLWSRRIPSELVWLSAPVVVFLMWHALTSRAGGQWLEPIYPTLAVIAALGLSAKTRLVHWAAPVGLFLGAVTMALGFWPGLILIKGHTPFTQVRGWDGTIDVIKARAKASGAKWIATDAYGLTSQLSHYFENGPLPVRSVTDPNRYLFLPALPSALCDAPALFISRRDYSGKIPYFVTSRAGRDISRSEADVELMRYHTAVVSGLKKCSSD